MWNALFDLCVIAWELYAGDGGVDVQRAFNEQSTFSYAHSIGPMTRRDAKMAREYQDVYQGRELSCETHIGRGSDDGDPASVRVYFCYDAPSGRVVVSHCGAHLSTYAGRGLS